MNNPEKQNQPDSPKADSSKAAADSTDPEEKAALEKKPTEHGGAKGLEPTRYGDWERNGRCTDF